MLGFSHIAWALIQVTKGGGRAKLVWEKEKKREFKDMKHHLCSAPVLSFPDLQQPFEIETESFDYVVGAVLTQHGHPMVYNSETLSDNVQKYPSYDEEMYSIVQAYHQWKHYILGKETIIHTDQKPSQFIQTQGKLHKGCHQKWSTYLQQFHLNIKYKTCISNYVVDYLSRPPVATLTTMLHSYGHETSKWPQLYQQDTNFATTYHILGTCTTLTSFHIQDELLCHLDNLCGPTSERAKIIWEAHYSQVAGYFGIEKTVVVLHKHFYWPKLQNDVTNYIIYFTS
jgi:hypothetical protein